MKEQIEYKETDRQLRNRWKMRKQMENEEKKQKLKKRMKNDKTDEQ